MPTLAAIMDGFDINSKRGMFPKSLFQYLYPEERVESDTPVAGSCEKFAIGVTLLRRGITMAAPSHTTYPNMVPASSETKPIQVLLHMKRVIIITKKK